MKARCLMLLTATTTLAACGGQSDAPGAEEAAHAPPADEPRAALPRTASAEGARVFFISPQDGDSLSNPVTIVVGIEGMSVSRAGDDTPNSGHHHLIIDADLPDPDLPIPADANHVHFGDGRTQTEMTLEPGEHSLQMLLGDHRHVPHDPPVVSQRMTVVVK